MRRVPLEVKLCVSCCKSQAHLQLQQGQMPISYDESSYILPVGAITVASLKVNLIVTAAQQGSVQIFSHVQCTHRVRPGNLD